MKRFEYAHVYINRLTEGEILDKMNIMGREGWEFVSIIERKYQDSNLLKQIAYFKREIIEPKNP